MPNCTFFFRSHAEACLIRTNYYNYISGFYFLASVGGSSIGSLLLGHHVYLLNGLSIVCYILAACVAAATPSHCGRNEKSDESSPMIIPDLDEDVNESLRPSLDERPAPSIVFNIKVI